MSRTNTRQDKFWINVHIVQDVQSSKLCYQFVSFQNSYLLWNNQCIALQWFQFQDKNHNHVTTVIQSIIEVAPRQSILVSAFLSAWGTPGQHVIIETSDPPSSPRQVPVLTVLSGPQGGGGGGGTCWVLRLPVYSKEFAWIKDWYIWSSSCSLWTSPVNAFFKTKLIGHRIRQVVCILVPINAHLVIEIWSEKNSFIF